MTQEEALTILKTGANVFLTGEPGSGKTHTLNAYIKYLRSHGIEPSITASTGIAATHIGGFTVHSWSGIGIRQDLTEYDLDHIAQNRNVARRVADAKVLIIDEVSMLSSATLTMVDAVCREIKRSPAPFGGLQVILVGDFFQLPPISAPILQSEQASFEENNQNQTPFAYTSPSWEALNPFVCYLSEQHRQEDSIFLEFLTSIRRGEIVEEHRELLRTRYAPAPQGDMTRLYSHNTRVDAINLEELNKLSGHTKTFTMESVGAEKLTEALKRGCLSPETLTLRIGARVMFTKNDVTTHRYANGTLGVVTEFTGMGYPVVKLTNGGTVVAEPEEWRLEDQGRVLARIIQIPLRLAWALTIHKSQGMSLDRAHMDLSRTFEYGQGYVALSRVRTLAGLSIQGLNERALEVHPDILEQDTLFREQSERLHEHFSVLSPEELTEMHANFIRASGGTLSARSSSHKSQPKKKASTFDATRELLSQKLSLKEMAKKRDMTVGTILNHLEKLVTEKKIDPMKDLAHLREGRLKKIEQRLAELRNKEGKILLGPAKERLGHTYTYEELRLARLFLM